MTVIPGRSSRRRRQTSPGLAPTAGLPPSQEVALAGGAQGEESSVQAAGGGDDCQHAGGEVTWGRGSSSQPQPYQSVAVFLQGQ